MVKLSVLYPRQDGGTFDMNYYREKHVPLARRLLAGSLTGLTVDEGVADAPYVVMCHLHFATLEAMQAALAEHEPALGGDIPNYTNVTPVFQVSTVVEG
jgi:uncharacterized protein (TIGR02118 family)